MCIWNEGCPDGMADYKLACDKHNYWRQAYPKQCPEGSEFIHDIGGFGATCWETCENGTEHDHIATCMGSCPAGTTLCGGEQMGVLCLDNDNEKTCKELMDDLKTLGKGWVSAISTQNWFSMISLARSEYPNIAYPMCEDW